MTNFTKTTRDITEYKPKMKPIYVSKTQDLHKVSITYGQTTIQVKADGEFNLIHMDKKEAYALNRFGRKTTDLPALNELYNNFKATEADEIELLAEMYAKNDNGEPLPLPTFIHYLKGDDVSNHKKIHLGLFTLLYFKVGKVIRKQESSKTNFKLMESLNGKLCHILDYIVPRNKQEIEAYWYQKVVKEKWEGLIIRNGETYKAKPNQDIDAVIIGINKNSKGYKKQLAKSVKVALMNENGNFIELGDSVVPTEQEAQEIFTLTKTKIFETNQTVYVKPLIVVKLNYISLFPNTQNTIRNGQTYADLGTTTLAKMKSPRIVEYRKDKKACIQDIGVNQIAE